MRGVQHNKNINVMSAGQNVVATSPKWEPETVVNMHTL
jgi:hypothetical protein